MTSFCVHFEKIERGLLREGKRREGAKRGGMNRKLPAVTHALFFQNEHKMMSRRCVPGRFDSAKKPIYTTLNMGLVFSPYKGLSECINILAINKLI